MLRFKTTDQYLVYMNGKDMVRFIDLFSVFKHKGSRTRNFLYFYELNIAILTENHAVFFLLAFLHGRDLGRI